jgi:hypothetical protein
MTPDDDLLNRARVESAKSAEADRAALLARADYPRRCAACIWPAARCARSPRRSASATGASSRSSKAPAGAGNSGLARAQRRA